MVSIKAITIQSFFCFFLLLKFTTASKAELTWTDFLPSVSELINSTYEPTRTYYKLFDKNKVFVFSNITPWTLDQTYSLELTGQKPSTYFSNSDARNLFYNENILSQVQLAAEFGCSQSKIFSPCFFRKMKPYCQVRILVENKNLEQTPYVIPEATSFSTEHHLGSTNIFRLPTTLKKNYSVSKYVFEVGSLSENMLNGHKLNLECYKKGPYPFTKNELQTLIRNFFEVSF